MTKNTVTDVKVGKGYGYKTEEDGHICMIRCFECGKENYGMTVSSGLCEWCRHDANKPDNKCGAI